MAHKMISTGETSSPILTFNPSSYSSSGNTFNIEFQHVSSSGNSYHNIANDRTSTKTQKNQSSEEFPSKIHATKNKHCFSPDKFEFEIGCKAEQEIILNTNRLNIVFNKGKYSLDGERISSGGIIHYNKIRFAYYFKSIKRNERVEAGITYYTVGICNELFYTEAWIDHVFAFINELRLSGVSINHISRLEIACDTTVDYLTKAKRFFPKTRKSKQYKPVVQHMKSGLFLIDNMDLGCKFSSNKREISIYLKKQECEKHNKQYIIDYLEANNIDISKEVQRVELDLTTKHIRAIDIDLCDITLLRNLTSQDFLKKILYEHRDLMSFRNLKKVNYNEHGNEIYTTACVMDFYRMPKVNVLKPVVIQESVSANSSAKGALKKIVYTYLDSGNATALGFVREYTIQYSLEGHLKKKYVEWRQDYISTSHHPLDVIEQRMRSIGMLF